MVQESFSSYSHCYALQEIHVGNLEYPGNPNLENEGWTPIGSFECAPIDES